MSQSENPASRKRVPVYLNKDKRGAFAATIMSGVVIAAFVVYYSISEEESKSLQLVIAVLRQGDRSPTKWETYPNDMYSPVEEGNWPNGLGQLTNLRISRIKKQKKAGNTLHHGYSSLFGSDTLGKLKSYEFGICFRKRYEQFLPVSYSKNSILVRSTDADRTEMTASTFLAGAFPPHGNQIWNKDLLWMPIPINSISPSEDNMLRVTKPCPAYNVEFERAKNETEKIMLKKYETFFNYVSNHTGMEIERLNDIENIYNSLNIQQRNHMTLPSWVKVKNYMQRMEDIVLEWLTTYSKTDKMKKLRSGSLIGEIVRLMRDKMDGKLIPDRKMIAYFTHEQTLIDLLRTLDIKNLFKPSFGSAIIFELHKIRDEHYVKIMCTKSYDTPEVITTLEMNSLNNFLPTLEDFIITTENYVPKNWDKECQLK